jgi:methanogenic corrinoid protein MtbC1
MDNLHHNTSQVIGRKREKLTQAIVAQLYGMEEFDWDKFGEIGHEKSLRDMEYHLTYLIEAISNESPVLFSDYVSWASVLFEGLEFPQDMVERILLSTQFILREELQPAPEMVQLVDQFITAGLTNLHNGPKSAPIFINERLPQGQLARDYLEALMHGERRTASQLILDAVGRGVSVQDIYLFVFQPVQYEVGRLWQTNQISVAQEHFCSFVTELTMSLLSPQIYNPHRLNRRLVATCVGSERHEIGMRIVADFFEMAGWDTYFLGANTPVESINHALSERKADLLAVSASLTVHLGEVADLISSVRGSPAGRNIKILVGGHPFNASDTLWQKVNADGYGRDAQHALEVANQLLG